MSQGVRRMLGRAGMYAGMVMWATLGMSAAFGMSGSATVMQAQAPQGVTGGQQAGMPTGTVTGRVMCSDTQRPARFAQVMLRRVPTDESLAGGGRTGNFFQGGGTAQTALDGSFVATGLAPGDYFVSANAAGYVPERQMVQAELDAGMSVPDILTKLPVVHVSANGVSSVLVTMDRGGTVAGQLQWEDGSPATGVVTTLVSTATTVAMPVALEGVPFYGSPSGFTDDRGRFRISGLPAGQYVLRASLRGPQPAGSGIFQDRRVVFSSQIVVWGQGVFRKGEAKPVTVKMGEERDDVRMVINLGALRTVSGSVSVASGPGLTGGRVTLSDATDKTVTVSGLIAGNGDFTVAYLPPGTYALQVLAAGPGFGRGGQGGGSAAVAYQPVTQTVVVGETDVTGVAVTLVPVQAAP